MITRRGLLPFAAVALVTLLAVPAGLAVDVFFAGNLVVAAILAGDWWTARRSRIDLARVAPEPLSVGRGNPVVLEISSRSARPLRLDVGDAPPADCDLRPLRHEVELQPGARLELGATLTPRRRGATAFAAARVRVRGPLGCCFSQRSVPGTAITAVTWPDVMQLRDERLLPAGRRKGGMRASTAGDRGREFDSLRDYVPGDEYRRISWKATARRGHPVVALTRPERRQHLMLGYETGRLMSGGGGDGLTKLDRAINAGVMLSAAAREFDDAVGTFSFGHDPGAALKPLARPGQTRRVVETLAELQPTLTEPDWTGALAALSRLTGRRSLIVLFTDVHYVETDDGLASRLGTVARRHIVLVASVIDHRLAQQAALPVTDERSLYRAGTAAGLLERRRAAVAALARRGVRAIDCPPSQLTPAVVHAFREIRQEGLV